MISDSKNHSIGLIVFHVFCLISYLVSISLSVYGYYAYFNLFTGFAGTGTVVSSFTWLIVAIVLDVFIFVLCITQCCVFCICGCVFLTNQSVQPIVLTPTVVVNTNPSTNARPPAYTDDNLIRIEFQKY